MKSHVMSRLLFLLFLCGWDSVHGLCVLEKQTSAKCADLEDARYIDTYNLHTLRASSSAEILAPGNFKNLTSLRHLDLSNGNIETIEAGSFAKLRSLMTLNLANNHIAHLEAGAFDGLKYLRDLKLSGNKIRQLPSALVTLKELRFLDVSDNPLNCNCASMKLRNALLTRGVKISKKTRCTEPISSKGMSLLKPDTKLTCVFETQDMEMQGDQAPEDIEGGSGGEEDEKGTYDDFGDEEKDVEKPADKSEEETPAPSTISEGSADKTEEETPAPSTFSEGSVKKTEEETPAPPILSESSSTAAAILNTGSEEQFLNSTTGSKDDITFEDAEDSSKKDSKTAASSEKDDGVDLDADEAEKKESKTQDSSKQASSAGDIFEGSGETDDEGSGEADDEGSGVETSSMISPVNVPEINFNDTFDNELDDGSSVTPSTSGMPTTTDSGWWGVWDALNPFGSSSETTTARAPSTTEKNPEEQAREEEFIPTATEPSKDGNEKQIVPRVSVQQSADQPATGDNPPDGESVVGSADSAPSQESQKGSGSYYVLATLLAILAVLIAFAAYKGDFCKKKRKRDDVERGTEMKDMQKSLLEQNAAQPKVQVSNGNTMENVPLMNSTTPEEPKENQKSYDITPAPTSTNGANKPVGYTTDAIDPVKPPRKGYGQEIEAPLNGLNPPMDDIDGPTTLQNGSDDALTNGDYNDEVPSLSPGAQKVKITMGELPESVPKTPILITRLKNGENLVKTP